MDNAFNIIVIVLSIVLFIQLVLGIVIAVLVVKLVKKLREIADKGVKLADKAEEFTSHFRHEAVSGLFKALTSLVAIASKFKKGA